MQQMKLVVTAGAAKSGAITIKPPMTLGRSRDADLTLRHALISRKHCEIVESEGAVMVRDLGSLNGTFVGGQRVNEAILNAGDELTVGSVTFRVEMSEADVPPAQAGPTPAAASKGSIPQGVDPETGLQFLEPVDAIETVPVAQVEVAQETTPAPSPEPSEIGTLEHADDETIQQPPAAPVVTPAEPAQESVPDIPIDFGDETAEPAAESQIEFALADDTPSQVNPSDVAFEVADDSSEPDADDSALGSFLKKL